MTTWVHSDTDMFVCHRDTRIFMPMDKHGHILIHGINHSKSLHHQRRTIMQKIHTLNAEHTYMRQRDICTYLHTYATSATRKLQERTTRHSQGPFSMFIQFHDGCLVPAAVAVVGGAEDGDHRLLVRPIVALHPKPPGDDHRQGQGTCRGKRRQEWRTTKQGVMATPPP